MMSRIRIRAIIWVVNGSQLIRGHPVHFRNLSERENQISLLKGETLQLDSTGISRLLDSVKSGKYVDLTKQVVSETQLQSADIKGTPIQVEGSSSASSSVGNQEVAPQDSAPQDTQETYGPATYKRNFSKGPGRPAASPYHAIKVTPPPQGPLVPLPPDPPDPGFPEPPDPGKRKSDMLDEQELMGPPSHQHDEMDTDTEVADMIASLSVLEQAYEYMNMQRNERAS